MVEEVIEYEFEELPEKVEKDGKLYVRKDIVQQDMIKGLDFDRVETVHPMILRNILSNATGHFIALQALSLHIEKQGNYHTFKKELANLIQTLVVLAVETKKHVEYDEFNNDYTEVPIADE